MAQAASLENDAGTCAATDAPAAWPCSCEATSVFGPPSMLPSAVLGDGRVSVVHVNAFVKGGVFLLSACCVVAWPDVEYERYTVGTARRGQSSGSPDARRAARREFSEISGTRWAKRQDARHAQAQEARNTVLHV